MQAVQPADPEQGDSDIHKSIERGQDLFWRRCAKCHYTRKATGHGIGPNLWGVVGRASGTVSGYAYSTGAAGKGIVWTREKLLKYLKNPYAMIPGTKMRYPNKSPFSKEGVKDPQEREDLVNYLAVLTDEFVTGGDPE